MEIGSDFYDKRHLRRMKRLSQRTSHITDQIEQCKSDSAAKNVDFSVEADDEHMACSEKMSRKGKNVILNGNSHDGDGGETSERAGSDLQYSQFLKNFREDEYTLVVKLEDDLELVYKYEPESCVKTQESSKKHASIENSEARTNPRVDLGNETRKNPKLERRLNSSEVREEAEMEEQEKEEEESEWDDFLKNLRNKEGVLVYKKIRYDYEEDESSPSDVMILSPEEIPQDFVTSQPLFINLDGDDCPVAEGDCEFRTKLVEKLKMPFDAKQYQMLVQEVNSRKPKKLERMLRGRDVSYTTDQTCMSYLERFPDFAEKIDSAEGDEPRILNLLRGFVFWLRNIANVGSFRPWMDPSCLKILPGLKSNADQELEDIEEM